jgi:hypothetical protein
MTSSFSVSTTAWVFIAGVDSRRPGVWGGVGAFDGSPLAILR